MNAEELMTRIDTAADSVEALATEAKAGGHDQAVLALAIAHGNLLAASCFVEGQARMDELLSTRQGDILDQISKGRRSYTGDTEEAILRHRGFLTDEPFPALTAAGRAALAAQTPPVATSSRTAPVEGDPGKGDPDVPSPGLPSSRLLTSVPDPDAPVSYRLTPLALSRPDRLDGLR